MSINVPILKAGAIGGALAVVVTMVFFDDDRRDARKWRKHVDYTQKCVDTKEDGTSVDQCIKRMLATARAFDKWSARCGRPDRPDPADCDKQLQEIE